MNIFFDVDGTLIGLDDERLRPGVRETLAQLVQDGHHVYVWSRVGIRWREVDRHQLREFVTDCFWKPKYDHHAEMVRLGVSVHPDFVIDDHAAVVGAFGGYHVRAYERHDPEDREMSLIYRAIVERSATGPASPGAP